MTLLLRYLSKNYNVTATCVQPDSRYTGDQWTCIKDKTTTNFKIQTADDDTFNNGDLDWVTAGYIDLTTFQSLNS